MTARAEVVVFGSLHYDILVAAPDRPRKGETVAGSAWRPVCGGKGGNQAVAAARAGAAVAMIGAVGDDDFGRALLANLASAGIDHSRVRRLPDTGSGMSVAIMDGEGDYGAVIVSSANLALSAEVAASAADALRAAKILVLQNEIPDDANVAAARIADAAGCRVILNAAPARILPDDLAAHVDLLVVNAIEAEGLGAAPVTTLDDALAAARHLARRCRSVAVTAGAAGVAAVAAEGSEVAIPAERVHVASTHGAGDAFIGTLAAEMARGAALAEALASANRAAARMVATPISQRA